MACKLQQNPTSHQKITTVTHSITVHKNFSWSAEVHGNAIDKAKCSALKSFSETVTTKLAVSRLLELVDSLNVCCDHPEQGMLDLADAHKGVFRSPNQYTVAFVDAYFPIHLNGEVHSRTVRTTSCELLVHGTKCDSCKQYRSTLRSLHSRANQSGSDKAAVSSHANFRYLNTPQRKKRMTGLRSAIKNKIIQVNRKTAEIDHLKSRLKETVEQRGIVVEKELEDDLAKIMEEMTDEISQKYPVNSFQQLFWKQQVDALQVRDRRQIKWHPMMIRWCLSSKLLSSASYHALRSSNLLVLPSERTLRDYTHLVQAKPGFQSEQDEQLCREAKINAIPEYQKFVCLVFDEVKVKEDLVYDKHTANLMGFVRIGDINDHLLKVEKSKESETLRPQLATHVLTFMVSGLFSDLEYPYASFQCTCITGDQLYSLVWGCVHRLEACGFKVVALTCDGASANRKFIRLHKSPKEEIVYKTMNPYANEDRPVFFISDPSHLIKTVRNCWANSHGHTLKRNLWVSFMHTCMRHASHSGNYKSDITHSLTPLFRVLNFLCCSHQSSMFKKCTPFKKIQPHSHSQVGLKVIISGA